MKSMVEMPLSLALTMKVTSSGCLVRCLLRRDESVLQLEKHMARCLVRRSTLLSAHLQRIFQGMQPYPWRSKEGTPGREGNENGEGSQIHFHSNLLVKVVLTASVRPEEIRVLNTDNLHTFQHDD